VLLEDGRVRVLADGFPVSPGRTLVAPVRHVASFFDLTASRHPVRWSYAQAEQAGARV
jgi:diadenosine tetraphosphate (Ap4A) HIT family hydrolase